MQTASGKAGHVSPSQGALKHWNWVAQVAEITTKQMSELTNIGFFSVLRNFNVLFIIQRSDSGIQKNA